MLFLKIDLVWCKMDDCWTIVLGFTEDYQTYKSLCLTCNNFYEFFQDGWETYRNGLQKLTEFTKKMKSELSGCDEVFDYICQTAIVCVNTYGNVNKASVINLMQLLVDNKIPTRYSRNRMEQFKKIMVFHGTNCVNSPRINGMLDVYTNI